MDEMRWRPRPVPFFRSDICPVVEEYRLMMMLFVYVSGMLLLIICNVRNLNKIVSIYRLHAVLLSSPPSLI